MNVSNGVPTSLGVFQADANHTRAHYMEQALGYASVLSVVYAGAVIIAILKMLCERPRIQTPESQKCARLSARANACYGLLSGDMAGPMAILCMAVILFLSGVVGGIVSFVTLDHTTCTVLLKIGAWTVVASLTALYALFEIRTSSVGGRLSGTKKLIYKAVQIGTRSGVLGSFGAVYFTDVYYDPETGTCVSVVPVAASAAMMLGDTGLSIGHMLVFYFLIQRHFRMKIEYVPPNPRRSKLALNGNGVMNAAPPTTEGAVMTLVLQKIARRNFRLSLIALVSTFASFGFITVITVLLGGFAQDQSHGFNYLRTLQLLVAAVDLQVNFTVALALTSKWRPKKLKWLLGRVERKGRTLWQRKHGIEPVEESEVSAFESSQAQ
jgi:hypothetical protein